MSCGRVLVVDDDDDTRESLTAVLECSGYHVDAVCDGNQAMASLRHDPSPCVILLDLMMPGLDGWGVVENLAHSKHLAALPVVITSAVSDEAPAGVAHVLSKPIDLSLLLGIIGKLCRSIPVASL